MTLSEPDSASAGTGVDDFTDGGGQDYDSAPPEWETSSSGVADSAEATDDDSASPSTGSRTDTEGTETSGGTGSTGGTGEQAVRLEGARRAHGRDGDLRPTARAHPDAEG